MIGRSVMSAILFGSLSTISDTSELQRESFNEAFAQLGLGWEWDRNQYRNMLSGNGGVNRITEYAESRGEKVDAAAVHHAKSVLFQMKLASSELSPRPGVAETVEGARSAGIKLGFITTTSPENISGLFTALSAQFSPRDFDLIVSSTDVDRAKPDPAAYLFALTSLREPSAGVVAIEDNEGGGKSATAAGVAWVAFPNANTGDHTFTDAVERTDHLDVDHLRRLVTAVA
jgi:HAD superfamily hydrolase (TIGR01509 family)